MNQNYRSDENSALPVITGDWDPEAWGYGLRTATRLFAKSYGLYAHRIDDLEVLTEVVLPNGRALKFRYSLFGEVAEIELPTGGKVQYDYGYASTFPSENSPFWETGTGGMDAGIPTDVKWLDRAVQAKRTYPDGVNLEGTRTFVYSSRVVGSTTHPSTTVSVILNTSGLLSKERHLFLPAGQYTGPGNSQSAHDGTHYDLWSTGVEWPTNDNRVNQNRRYLEIGMMAKVGTLYDQYSNPIEVKEYDYDQTVKRRTVTSYLSTNNGHNYQTGDSIHLLSLPATKTVFDGNGNQVARTITEYDIYTNDGNRNPLTSYLSISQHDSSYGTTKQREGILTRIGIWLNTTGSYVYTYPCYDVVGDVVSMKDPRGNLSTVSFADDYGDGSNPRARSQNPATPMYAFLPLVTSHPLVPGAPNFTRSAANGRLVAVTYGTNSSAGDYSGYDSAGRSVLTIQQTGGLNYQLSTMLDLADAPTSVVYPSGRTINYTYDSGGRTASVVGNLGDGTSRNYSTDISYSSLGGSTKEKFGTTAPVYHKLHYNVRGQLCDVRTSNINGEWGGEFGALANFYSTNGVRGGSGPDNNGNVVKSQTILGGYYMEDRYTYDALNRPTANPQKELGYRNGQLLVTAIRPVQLCGTNYLSFAEIQIFTGSATPPIQWFMSDHLETPRMIIDQSASPPGVKRHDYLPFGEELFAPADGRTAEIRSVEWRRFTININESSLITLISRGRYDGSLPSLPRLRALASIRSCTF